MSRQRAAFTATTRCSIFPIPEADTRKRQTHEARHDHQTSNAPPTAGPAGARTRRYDQRSTPRRERNLHHLAQYLGNPDSTIVSGERFVVPTPGTPANQRISPDLLISFNANPALYRQDNSYVISRQGKPPDLVMEIASRRTGEIDARDKPARYAALGISEYWRCDETGEFHGTRLAGDRLVGGQYEPISIEEVEPGVLQGYSSALSLFVRWERGELRWHDPETGQENTHLRAGTGRPVGSRGPGQGTGGGTGKETRRGINSRGSGSPHAIQQLPTGRQGQQQPVPFSLPEQRRESGGSTHPAPGRLGRRQDGLHGVIHLPDSTPPGNVASPS